MKVGPLILGALALLALSGRRTSGKGAAGRLTMADLETLARDAGFPDAHLAAAVAMAESGGNPRAVGVGPKERSIGLWQINIHVWKIDEEVLKDPATNARHAYAIYLAAGKKWTPWGAYTNGSYKKYM